MGLRLTRKASSRDTSDSDPRCNPDSGSNAIARKAPGPSSIGGDAPNSHSGPGPCRGKEWGEWALEREVGGGLLAAGKEGACDPQVWLMRKWVSELLASLLHEASLSPTSLFSRCLGKGQETVRASPSWAWPPLGSQSEPGEAGTLSPLEVSSSDCQPHSFMVDKTGGDTIPGPSRSKFQLPGTFSVTPGKKVVRGQVRLGQSTHHI